MKIVYESNTGFTEQYAKMLSKTLDIPCVKLKDYKPDFKQVIFLGWVMAGMVKGYNKIKNRATLSCTIAVGLFPNTEDHINELIKNNNINEKFFYLQGGVNYKKLKCVKKMLLRAVGKKLVEQNNTENEKVIEIIKNGGSLVKEENLNEIIDYINSKND